MAPLVGHVTLRTAAMGYAQRPPTADEQGRMRARLGTAMAEDVLVAGEPTVRDGHPTGARAGRVLRRG